MSDLLYIATIVLAGIVQFSLQLNFGALLVLYSASMGKHRRRKTRYLAKSYIWGVGAISFLITCASCFLVEHFFDGQLSRALLSILVGVFVACGIIMPLLYYRKKNSTELWLPKSVTRYISRKAKNTSDNVEAFSLGVLSGLLELPFCIAIYLIVANSILSLSVDMQILGALTYTFFAILPSFLLKLQIKTGKNAVEAQKWRIKHNSFIRVISGCGFGVLALFIIAFWIY